MARKLPKKKINFYLDQEEDIGIIIENNPKIF